MSRLTALVVCLMVCALFGVTFGQENDFRETQSFKKRDLPLNPETIKPCLDSVDFLNSIRTISNSYRGPQSITAADFNRNGRQDVAVAYATDNKVVLFNNNGDGKWSANVLGTVNGASAVFAADLNGDNKIDVVAASETDSSVYWFKNNGNGYTQYSISGATAPRSLFVADINGDDKPDIIVAGDSVSYLENHISNAEPNGWTTISVTYTGSPIDSLFAADLDNNGFVDLVVASSAGNLVAWLNNTNGAGTSFDQITIAQPTGPAQAFGTDIDADGYVDVITANAGENATAIYYNNLGSTNHTLPAGSNNSATASSGWVGVYVDKEQNAPESVFVTDINGDGHQDVVVAITGSNLIKWYDATDNNYTWTGFTVGSATRPDYVFARDLDGDNAKDVIFTSTTANRLGWFEELCSTSRSDGGDDEHVVGWAVAGGVIGGLLILWILIIIAIAIHDYIKHQMRKAADQRKKEAKAMLPTEHDDL